MIYLRNVFLEEQGFLSTPSIAQDKFAQGKLMRLPSHDSLRLRQVKLGFAQGKLPSDAEHVGLGPSYPHSRYFITSRLKGHYSFTISKTYSCLLPAKSIPSLGKWEERILSSGPSYPLEFRKLR